jgi:hypothetical protein
MAKDFKKFTIHVTRSQTYNWFIGIDYYEEYAYTPSEVIARVCQLGLLFFRITITKWETGEVFDFDGH